MATIDITVSIDESLVVSALQSAPDGIRYWASRIDPLGTDTSAVHGWFADYALAGTGSHIRVIETRGDDDKPKAHRLTRHKIMRGLATMARVSPRQFGLLVMGNGDAVTGDVLVQCTLFGEVKYG